MFYWLVCMYVLYVCMHVYKHIYYFIRLWGVLFVSRLESDDFVFVAVNFVYKVTQSL